MHLSVPTLRMLSSSRGPNSDICHMPLSRPDDLMARTGDISATPKITLPYS